MLLFFYNILLHSLLFLGFPLWIWLVIQPKYRRGILRKLGLSGQNPNPSNEYLMIHGVSVGEINAALPFIEMLKKKFPNQKLLVTTSTMTGFQNASQKLEGCLIEYFPLDFLWSIHFFFRKYRISKIFILETELWPNFINEAKKNSIPAYLVNARISDKSYPRYLKFRPFIESYLKNFSHFFCQSDLDGTRCENLGVDPTRITVTGSMKLDSARFHLIKHENSPRHLPTFRFRSNGLIFLAGSTQEEENLICTETYLELKKSFPDLKFILVPRKPDSIGKVLQFLQKTNISFSLRSIIPDHKTLEDIFIVNTIGELFYFYELADLVFVGKSLVPGGGGQNPVEPAILGKPVIMGSSYENFREIVSELIKHEGIFIIRDSTELKTAVKKLITDNEKRQAMGKNAKEFIFRSPSVCEKILEKI